MRIILRPLYIFLCLAVCTGLVGAQEQKVTGSDTTGGNYFGRVSIDGDYAIVGAYGHNSFTGAAYIFHNSGGTWTQQAKLTASDGADYDWFGYTVSISGDYAIVGAHMDNSYTGAAYIFHRSGTSWTQQTKLTGSDSVANDTFGISVSIDGDYAVVGADEHNNGTGAAYVFLRSGGTWTQQAKLTASDGAADDDLGECVSISGAYVICGAEELNTHTGAAYIFHRSGTTWTEQAKLAGSDSVANDYFGTSVSISGDYAVVGADEHNNGIGAAYVFHRSGASWTQQAKLTASDGVDDDDLGEHVSITGDYVICGADEVDNSAGAAYVFRRSGSAWKQIAKLTASDGTASDAFSDSAQISGKWALVGAYYDNGYAGSAYFIDGSPQVTSPTVTNVTCYNAVLGGTVDESGWYLLKSKGVVWSRKANPTLNDCQGSASLAGALGTFTVKATGLIPNTTYHFRAFGTSALGTSYSADETFTTGMLGPNGSLQATLKPSGARDSDAAWKIEPGDGTWHASGNTISPLAVGNYTVVFKDIDGWITPDEQHVYINDGQLTFVKATYVKEGTAGDLTVNFTSTSAIDSGSRWRIKGPVDSSTPPVNLTRWRESGESIALEAGTYVIEFLPVPGWLHLETEVTVKAGKDVEVQATGVPFLVLACTDFDGDGIGDIACYNPSTRTWTVKDGLAGKFGRQGAWPVAGDYDGNGTSDLAYWLPKRGLWRVKGHSNIKDFGAEGDLPVPGDYDGDGICDPALYRPSTGEWMMVLSGETAAPGKTDVTVLALGGDAYDIPVPADYDGNGTIDAAVYNFKTQLWRVDGYYGVKYGRADEFPMPADCDGDGIADFTVVDLDKGLWRVMGASSIKLNSAAGDFPVLLDLDGDGIPEPGYYRFDEGCWYVVGADGSESKIEFGSKKDLPLSK